jgi:hypothetical protein
VALAALVGSATLRAVTVTAWGVTTLDGAVYRPAEEIEPTGGLIDQVTAAFAAPKTVAVNCCVAEDAKVTVDGLIDTVTVCGIVITAVAAFEESTTLLAVNVRVCAVDAVLGAT